MTKKNKCMIRVNPEFKQKIKVIAANEGKTMNDVLEDLNKELEKIDKKYRRRGDEFDF